MIEGRAVVVEVIRSNDGCRGVRSQAWRGSVSHPIGGDIPRGKVVFGTSFNRDIVSLGSLQDEGHELVNVAVRVIAPRRWGLQKGVE